MLCNTRRMRSIAFLAMTFTLSTTLVASTEPKYYSYEPEEFLKSYQTFRANLTSSCNAEAESESAILPTDTKNRNTKNPLIVAAVQLETSVSSPNNHPSLHAQNFYDRAVKAVEDAVQVHGATLVLLQELFLGPYFCQSQEASLFALAENNIHNDDHHNSNKSSNILISKFQQLAKRLNVVLPISIFERSNNVYYNTIVLLDSDGTNLGSYRKSHIPDGTGYQEKFYFSPGDTGFRVFHTKVGTIGVGICWDQWFPEAARSMALMGADVLLYPTAIGTEPQDPTLDSSNHWQRVMQGHAAANMVPVIAANRYGAEVLLKKDGTEKQRIRFYGRSFITDETGQIVKEARDGTDIIVSGIIDVEKNRATRSAWGLFRDRRPELYDVLKTKDGTLPLP